MPANLTPEFKKAQEWFKSAATDDERILALEEMLRTIPKHKGTEHMQADLKSRLSKLRSKKSSAKKSSSGHTDIFHVPKTGAGQVALIGTPNTGKSSIVGAISNAKVKITDYPFATDKPLPGVAMHEDVKIELVDTPPITNEYAAPGQVQTYRGADLIAIVIDLAADPLDQIETCLEYLNSHRLILDKNNPATDPAGNPLARPTFIIATKSDIVPKGTLETFKELTADKTSNLECIPISENDPASLEYMLKRIFEMLDIVRIYAKKPGEEPDKTDPFTLPRGSTVDDLAKLIHRELAEKLQSARAWGTGVYDGQNVQKNHILNDKDVIELHFP
jgi:hypothetical protein